MHAHECDDYLLIQFGHNDGGNIDKAKFRGTLPGMGDETQLVTRDNSVEETVHTFGWYMSNYIEEAKAKGVTVVVLSMIPRNIWADGKIERVDDTYGGWAKRAAEQNQAYFIDLNNTIAEKYEQMEPEEVQALFPKDHTHTNADGAKLNAQTVTEQLKTLRGCNLSRYLK